MTNDRTATAAFTGHRTYRGEGDEALKQVVGAFYDRGFRTLLSGMAVGFDLAAAEVVLACRAQMPDLQLVAVVPFEGQEGRFSEDDRARFHRVLAAADQVVVLSPVFDRGCYTVRNNYLIDHASALIAWYDGSSGGTHYTVRRGLRRGLRVENIHPKAPVVRAPDPELPF